MGDFKCCIFWSFFRYQCLRCLNYDLCQHCFFHGNRNRHHKLEHPMQEYCYRSTKKDATKAFLKLLINKVRKRKLSQMRQRYLSPQSKTGKGVTARDSRSGGGSNRPSDNNSADDSSGFHSENSSEQGERNRSPSTDTVDNAHVANAEDATVDNTTNEKLGHTVVSCLLYTSPSPRDS